jgi:predicted LPLAT superfamily acyltransferase
VAAPPDTGLTSAPAPVAPGNPVTPRDAAGNWLGIAEVGTVFGIRFVVALYRFFGRRATHAFLRVLALYYVTFHRVARRASLEFWARLGQPTSWRQAYRHIFTFAVVAVDRLVFTTGRVAGFELCPHGTEHLEAARTAGKGALLIGAHLGSFECLRFRSKEKALPLTIVANFSNAEMINGVLRRLDPTLNTRVINVDESLSAVLRIRECIDRGELVAILADRVGPTTRALTVDFLGGRARLPAGPFLLAATLRCPVLLTFGLYRGDRTYELFCEPFADPLILPRQDRGAALAATAQRFADRLAHYVALQPNNWFNFYRFWEAA